MPTNANQFLRELNAETRAIETEFVGWRADLVRDMLRVARSRTPERSGRTKRSWGANAGPKPDFGSWNGSPGEAAAALRQTKPGARIHAGNAHFISSWIEKGTVKMTARPMLRVGIEHIANREKK